MNETKSLCSITIKLKDFFPIMEIIAYSNYDCIITNDNEQTKILLSQLRNSCFIHIPKIIKSDLIYNIKLIDHLDNSLIGLNNLIIPYKRLIQILQVNTIIYDQQIKLNLTDNAKLKIFKSMLFMGSIYLKFGIEINSILNPPFINIDINTNNTYNDILNNIDNISRKISKSFALYFHNNNKKKRNSQNSYDASKYKLKKEKLCKSAKKLKIPNIPSLNDINNKDMPPLSYSSSKLLKEESETKRDKFNDKKSIMYRVNDSKKIHPYKINHKNAFLNKNSSQRNLKNKNIIYNFRIKNSRNKKYNNNNLCLIDDNIKNDEKKLTKNISQLLSKNSAALSKRSIKKMNLSPPSRNSTKSKKKLISNSNKNSRERSESKDEFKDVVRIQKIQEELRNNFIKIIKKIQKLNKKIIEKNKTNIENNENILLHKSIIFCEIKTLNLILKNQIKRNQKIIPKKNKNYINLCRKITKIKIDEIDIYKNLIFVSLFKESDAHNKIMKKVQEQKKIFYLLNVIRDLIKNYGNISHIYKDDEKKYILFKSLLLRYNIREKECEGNNPDIVSMYKKLKNEIENTEIKNKIIDKQSKIKKNEINEIKEEDENNDEEEEKGEDENNDGKVEKGENENNDEKEEKKEEEKEEKQIKNDEEVKIENSDKINNTVKIFDFDEEK